MSGLGERGSRLRTLARQLRPAPAVPPFYVQRPDEQEIRAVGWYMRRTRGGPAIYLGHSAAAGEYWLRVELEKQNARRRPRKRAAAKGASRGK